MGTKITVDTRDGTSQFNEVEDDTKEYRWDGKTKTDYLAVRADVHDGILKIRAAWTGDNGQIRISERLYAPGTWLNVLATDDLGSTDREDLDEAMGSDMW